MMVWQCVDEWEAHDRLCRIAKTDLGTHTLYRGKVGVTTHIDPQALETINMHEYALKHKKIGNPLKYDNQCFEWVYFDWGRSLDGDIDDLKDTVEQLAEQVDKKEI